VANPVFQMLQGMVPFDRATVQKAVFGASPHSRKWTRR
jgi:hypothetical protein